MKKIILGLVLVFVMNFGLKARIVEQGCDQYCHYARTCCEQRYGSGNCDDEFQYCITKHKNTPSDQCPALECN